MENLGLTNPVCIRRRRQQSPLLPTCNATPSNTTRKTTYLIEMNIAQDWIGAHAAGWSISQPRVHRIADS